MAAPRKYPDELRERAVRLVLDAKKDPVTRPAACRRIGEQLGINPETLRGWVNQAETDAGERPGTTTSDTQRLAELEREVRVSRVKLLAGFGSRESWGSAGRPGPGGPPGAGS
ncbi:transposase, partial [Cellulosimicrobium composti]|uniref:transposase n=1 Tax=Cellulosimicrobium composti TaxID=2672572 RepID=UPI0037B8662A